MINTTTLILSFVLLMACIVSKSTGKQIKLKNGLIGDPEHHIKDKPKITQHNNTILYTGWYYVADGGKGFKRQLDKSKESYFIDRHPIITASNFTAFSIDGSTLGGAKYSYRLIIQLDNAGAGRWAVATKKSIGKQLAFILDNRLLYVAKVFNPILNGTTVIDRGNSKEEIEKLKAIIESER